MSYKSSVLALLLCLGALQSGCSICQLTRLVSLEEPKLYDTKKDQEISLATYRSLADEAWVTTETCCPEDCISADYTWGFKEGFAEYVYAGGPGDPPALPPRSYWQTDMRNAEGAMAVRSWFEGYRHGAQVAREGGYRQTATVAVSASVRDCDACGRPNGCGRDGCDSCSVKEAYRYQGVPLGLESPRLQQPEFHQTETVVPEITVPEKVLPPPLPSLESSDDLDLPLMLDTGSWKTKESVTSIHGSSFRSPSVATSTPSTEKLPVQEVASQKHSVKQTFFPIVR